MVPAARPLIITTNDIAALIVGRFRAQCILEPLPQDIIRPTSPVATFSDQEIRTRQRRAGTSDDITKSILEDRHLSKDHCDLASMPYVMRMCWLPP